MHFLERRTDVAVISALVAYALVAFALAISDGHDNHLAEVLTTGSIVAVGAGLLAARRVQRPSGVALVVAWCVALGSTLSVLVLSPGRFVEASASQTAYIVLSSSAIALVASYAIDLRRRTSLAPVIAVGRRLMMFAVAFALGVWMLGASPAPLIDVWSMHQQGARALLHGHSVYAPGMIDVEDTHSFSRRIDLYVYPPLGAILSVAAYAVMHDTRWTQLVALLVGAAFLWLLARRVSRSPTLPDLLVACLLFHPRGLFVLEQAWGEPLALPFLGGFALAAEARRFRLAAVLLGLLCALKQHFVMYLPALALVPGIGVSGVLIAAAMIVATCVPFVVATPTAFWNAVVVHHLKNPFRGDSLSLTAMLADLGVVLPSWVGLVASLASLALLRVPRKPGPLLMASSLTFMLFYVLGRQAFCNYYYLVGASWLFAGASLADAGG